jgi:hypothetical protein
MKAAVERKFTEGIARDREKIFRGQLLSVLFILSGWDLDKLDIRKGHSTSEAL